MLKYVLLWASMLPLIQNQQQFMMKDCKNGHCHNKGDCLLCEYPDNCKMGEILTIRCTSLCESVESEHREAYCSYCWQLDPSLYDCEPVTNCTTTRTGLVKTTCEVKDGIHCKGNRLFSKKVRCNWSSGFSWTKAMLYSITLGGFGADRFYLGLWKSAIGKLFSFGGLGIWTVLDIILIATGYIRPADGSLYM
ncbi:unnamed protein product [Auanema sp. JU1783]|nr:unnamed protein product [Auanema sp. JU1783]